MTWTIPRCGELVPATVELAERMAANLNDEDYSECLAMGMTGHDALRVSVEKSIEAWAWILDGEPVVMAGVTYPYILGFKRPWCLSARKLRENPYPFLIGSRDFVRHVSSKYKFLESQVDARYKLSVDWIKWLGFTVDPDPVFIGPDKVPFLNLKMVAP